jgi:PE-PPE domain/PE family
MAEHQLPKLNTRVRFPSSAPRLSSAFHQGLREGGLMAYVLTQPEVMMTAAADVAEMGSALNQAHAAAAGPISGVVAAAADEVSAATATLFSTYAREYQAVTRQAAAFQDAFTRALVAAGNAYANAEAAASGALGVLAAPLEVLLAPLTGGAATGAAKAAATVKAAFAPVPVAAALIMSESGVPTPSATYINNVYTKYVQPNFPSATPPQGVSIANGLYPFTGVKDLTLNVSAARGVTELNNAILQQLAALPAGSSIAVLGYSQSAIVASLEMPQLLAQGVSSSQVNFVLLGDPMNPNGGLLARFPGLTLPSLGLTFYGATPANAFPTVIYTLEYDGFADFPQYPIDFLADLNALMGIVFVHGNYAGLTAAQIGTAVQLPTQGATQTTYDMIPTKNLPLLDPVRFLPYVGNPMADLLQPDLRYLVNWGYGNPAYGYSTGPANVPTPFGFLPPLSATTALGGDLVIGTQQGIAAAASDLYAQGLPSLPHLSLSGISEALTSRLSAPGTLALPTATSPASVITNLLLGLEAANNNVVGGFTTAVSTAYGALLPTADIATAIAVSYPSYDVNLFLNGIMQAVNGHPVAGLLNAIGDPIAADVGLVTVTGGFELIVIAYALDTIFLGAPHPIP